MTVDDRIAKLMLRAPFQSQEGIISGADLVAYYRAIEQGKPEPHLMLGPTRSSRRVERANEVLKRAGLVSYDRGTGTWVARSNDA